MDGVIRLVDLPLAPSLVGGESWREPRKDLRQIVRVPAVPCIVVQIGQNRAPQGRPIPGFVAEEDKVGHRPPAAKRRAIACASGWRELLQGVERHRGCGQAQHFVAPPVSE
jgi:hypothetical protein